MPANRTTLDKAMQDLFLSPLVSLVNNNLLQEQITSGGENVQGRKAVFGLHVGRSTGLGAITDGGNLPAADNQKYNQGAVGLSTLVGRVELTGKTLRTLANGQATYVTEPQGEIEGLAMDAKRDFCRQLFGTGDGVLASTGATTTSNTVVIANGDLAKTGHFTDGARVDIGTVANPTAIASNRLITAVNTNAAGVVTSIVIDGAAVTTATTDRVFRTGNGGTQTDGGLTYGKEINGLQNIISDTGVLHTIDPSSASYWKSYVKDLAGLALSESVIMEAAHRVSRTSASTPGLVITTDGALRVLASTLESRRRIVNEVSLKGGFSAIEVSIAGGGVNQVAATWDRDVPGGQAFGVAPDVMKLHNSGSDWKWDDSDGAVLKHISGRDAQEAYIVKDVQLATSDRRRHVKFINCDETV